VYKNLSLYNKNHSEKVKMYCGVEITALYLVKETKDFYVSTEVWAFVDFSILSRFFYII